MDHLIVHNLIVHELKKQPESAETELLLSKDPLPITAQSIELIGRLSATKLPSPWVRTRIPCSHNSCSARLAVIRLTVNFAASSFSEGTRSPAHHCLLSMRSMMCSLIAM